MPEVNKLGLLQSTETLQLEGCVLHTHNHLTSLLLAVDSEIIGMSKSRN